MPKISTAFVPYATTQFCEDIRFEMSGSVTLVGVFTKDIIVPRLPVILPRLGIFTTTIIPPVGKKKPKIQFLVYLPGDNDKPSVSIDESDPAIITPEHRLKRDSDIPPHTKILQQLVISPLQIPQEGYLKVRTLINGELIKAGVIKVLLSAPEQTESSIQNDN